MPLEVSSGSGLRNDVDSAEDLTMLAGLIGVHTARVVADEG
jgi:hypothetical protein